MRKISLNFETIASVCAIVTSLVALYVAVEQTKLMQEEKHANVLPIVTSQITINQVNDKSFIKFALVNVGIGPANVRNGDLYIGEHLVSGYQSFQDNLLVGSLKESVSVETSNMQGFVGTDDSKTLLELSWQRSEENDKSFVEMVNRFVDSGSSLRISVCYCSVFNVCFASGDGNSNGPKEVEACEVQEVDPIIRILETVSDAGN